MNKEKPVSIRLDDDVINKLDELIEVFDKNSPATKATRSTVARHAILKLYNEKCEPKDND